MSSSHYLISKIIERIGDHIIGITKNVQHLKSKNQNPLIINKIEIKYNQALYIFNKSIGMFYRKDIISSNENIDSVKKLKKLCEEISNLTIQQKEIVAISIGYIIESIRRIGEYAEDISQIVINYLIDEEK